MIRRPITLRLFGGFEMRIDGDVVEVAASAHRLVGLLALGDRLLSRSFIASELWPETCEERAHANLRTALWRLRPFRDELLVTNQMEIGLAPTVIVDARSVHDAARAYRRTGQLPTPEFLLETRGELLPECWDSWLIFDRERLRLETIELLQACSRDCVATENFHVATLLAMRAVECDPLLESANILVVKSRLGAGDVSTALRHIRCYANLLEVEIGLSLPAEFDQLLASHLHNRAVTPRLPEQFPSGQIDLERVR